MKIYTKAGDDGSTGLIGGQRVSKTDPRIECIGVVDELNAAVGWAAVSAEDELAAKLRAVQNELFVIGSQLAWPDAHPPAHLPALEESSIGRLEMEIDTTTAALEPLRNFILPGGSETSARLHMARAVCRRAERVTVGFSQDRPVPNAVLTYVNRLSDWLFVQARWANKCAGVEDVLWEK
ncbi:MAG TPA: cob(I)yrinic acid a,c-diamide adenosyltransferase [Tepidisphaeraceae bacterium]|jgi:cob(I)alamin adenosyltransferase|nr:cob(I)yrinic acid a,c-diamide adenosyltransferase [Tepidisphaeraceae bacterium]